MDVVIQLTTSYLAWHELLKPKLKKKFTSRIRTKSVEIREEQWYFYRTELKLTEPGTYCTPLVCPKCWGLQRYTGSKCFLLNSWDSLAVFRTNFCVTVNVHDMQSMGFPNFEFGLVFMSMTPN